MTPERNRLATQWAHLPGPHTPRVRGSARSQSEKLVVAEREYYCVNCGRTHVASLWYVRQASLVGPLVKTVYLCGTWRSTRSASRSFRLPIGPSSRPLRQSGPLGAKPPTAKVQLVPFPIQDETRGNARAQSQRSDLC
jgi:hypothetical protein